MKVNDTYVCTVCYAVGALGVVMRQQKLIIVIADEDGRIVQYVINIPECRTIYILDSMSQTRRVQASSTGLGLEGGVVWATFGYCASADLCSRSGRARNS